MNVITLKLLFNIRSYINVLMCEEAVISETNTVMKSGIDNQQVVDEKHFSVSYVMAKTPLVQELSSECNR